MRHLSAIRGTWRGYLLALLLSGVMVLLRFPLSQLLGHESPLVFLPLAVLLAAWYGGLGAGLFATALSTAGTAFFFIDPTWSFQTDVRDLQQILFFITESIVLCLLIHAVHRTKDDLARSEERAVNIVESINDVFFSVDSAWRLNYVNQNAAQLAGRPAAELVGESLWTLWPDLTGTPIEEKYRQVMHERVPAHFEFEGLLTNTWYEISVYPAENGISIYGRDVSDRKCAEYRLRESERRLRLALDAARLLAWEWDPETDEVLMSDNSEKVYGLPDTLLADDLLQMMHPDDRPEHQENVRKAIASGGSFHTTFRTRPQDDSKTHWLEAWGYADLDDDGRLQRMVGIIMNITERKEAEEALRESEEVLQSILDQLPVGVILADAPSGRMIYYNKEAQRQLRGMLRPSADHSDYDKYEAHDSEGRPFEPDEIPMVRALRGKEVRDVEWHYSLPDGTELVSSVYAGPVRNGQGEIVRAVSAFSDISDRKEMEEALRRQANMLQLSHDAIFVWRLGGAIEFWNRGAEELYGFTADEAHGQVSHELLQSKLPTPWADIEATLRAEGLWEGELRQTAKSGREIVVSSRKQLVREPKGDLVVLETNRDITERKQYEEGLERAKEEAEHLAQTKTALLANMSHEVRTPLTGLLILAEVLASRLTGKNRETVIRMKKGAEKLSDLLDAVLTLSRLEAGHVEIQSEVLDLREEVERAAAPLIPLAEQKDLALTIAGPAPCYAHVDGSSLNSVLNNLIGNAIKFTDEGAVTVELEQGNDDRVGGPAVLLHVRDTGPGISEAFLPHIFEEFRQESTGNTRTHGGAGLGLAISKRLVDLMDGVIDVESEPGVGTTFTLLFPAARSAAQRLPTQEVPFDVNGTQPHILFMDDDALTLELVPDLLRDFYEVEKASTPQEALEQARATYFDAILLDISMGADQTGEDVLHALRQMPWYQDTPIIAVTAYALPGDEARFLNEGFDGYVSKPFEGAELTRTLKEALAKVAR